jgi:hypothetical protein
MAFIPKMKENIEQLKKIVEQQHNCVARFVESVQVKEIFQGQTVWHGTVHVFDIQGHSKATRCYAWSSPIDGSTKRRYYAVLHAPPVDSPEKAVRAAIVQEFRKKEQNGKRRLS